MNVFISHSLNDGILLNAIAERIKAWGHTPKYAEQETVADDVSPKIQKLIDESKFFLLLFTKKASESQFVNQEIGYAQKAKLPIFILKEDGVELNGFIHSHDCMTIKSGADLSPLKNAIEKHESKLTQNAGVTILSIIGGLALLSAFSKN